LGRKVNPEDFKLKVCFGEIDGLKVEALEEKYFTSYVESYKLKWPSSMASARVGRRVEKPAASTFLKERKAPHAGEDQRPSRGPDHGGWPISIPKRSDLMEA